MHVVRQVEARLPRLTACLTLFLALSTAGNGIAAPVEVRGLKVDLGEGWTETERVDAVAMQSVTLERGDTKVVLAVGPNDGERAAADVTDLAQGRMDAQLPMLLEDNRRVSFKVAGLKVAGLKGVGTTAAGVDLMVQCGTASGTEQVLAVCAAGAKKELGAALKALQGAVQLGAPGRELDMDMRLTFEGISLPVPAGWDSFQVGEGALPFAHLAQKNAGFLRVIKLPPAMANIPIPWELVAGWVANAGAGPDSKAETAEARSLMIGDREAKLRSFHLMAAEREGRLIFIHPFGRKDLVLFGLGRSPRFDAWFDAYLKEIQVTAAFDPTEPKAGEGGSLLDTVRGLLGGGDKPKN